MEANLCAANRAMLGKAAFMLPLAHRLHVIACCVYAHADAFCEAPCTGLCATCACAPILHNKVLWGLCRYRGCALCGYRTSMRTTCSACLPSWKHAPQTTSPSWWVARIDSTAMHTYQKGLSKLPLTYKEHC